MAKKEVEKKEDEKKELDRSVTLKMIRSALKKEYGKKVIRDGADPVSLDERRARFNTIKTGSLGLDRLTGVGGLVTGRMGEIHGKSGVFKTGTLLCWAKAAQKQGFFVLFIDVEQRLDVDRAKQLGVDVDDEDKFMLITPDTGDQALSVAEKMLRTVPKVFVIIDSMSALLPESDLKKALDGGNRQMGSQARLIAEGLIRIIPVLAKSESLLWFTNQHRTQMSGIFTYRGKSGGKAPTYYDTYILHLKWNDKDNVINDEYGNQIGQWIEYEMEKNTTDFPGRKRLVPVHLGHGFWKEYEYLLFGQELGYINKSGAWYSIMVLDEKGDPICGEDGNPVFEKMGQGKQAACDYLVNNIDKCASLEIVIRKGLGIYHE